MSEIGTLAWAEANQGRLTPREMMTFAARGVGSQMRAMPLRLAAALGLKKERLARIDLDQLKIPDTAAAREAEEACASLPPSVASHSHRTFLWGAALAAGEKVSYDPEMFYCASLLHDIALPGATNGDGVCFTVKCASHAGEIAERAGWEESRRHALREALVLHFNPTVSLDKGAEAHLLNAAAALDVIGMRAWEIDRDTFKAVIDRHPRMDFKREVTATLRAHAKSAPKGRVAFLFRYGAFGQLIKYSPFDE